ILADKYVKMTANYGSDSMIETRNLSVGDGNNFEDGGFVAIETHSVDVRDIIGFVSRKSEDEVIRMLCRAFERDVENRVEDAFSNAGLQISNLKDVRKIMRIVIDSDVIIHLEGYRMTYKMGIGFRQNG